MNHFCYKVTSIIGNSTLARRCVISIFCCLPLSLIISCFGRFPCPVASLLELTLSVLLHIMMVDVSFLRKLRVRGMFFIKNFVCLNKTS